MNEVMSFLLINRSVPTGDFTRDETAAVATRDAIAAFLQTELGTLPNASSGGGFTYRLEPALGVLVRSSDSFGPFFTERSLTAGRGQVNVAVGVQHYEFRTIDGRNLRDGTLVSSAARLRTDAQPFDKETLTLKLATDTVTLQTNIGLTDRLDVGAAMPLIRLTLSGQRLDTYRGTTTVQATAAGTAFGVGDAVLRSKYNLLRYGGSGIALGAEARLPTGDKENLLGTGNATVSARAIGSFERGRAGMHGNVGYVFGGRSDEVDFRAATTLVADPRVTIVVEVAGRRLASIGRLAEVFTPHPTLANVDTLRLSTTDAATTRAAGVVGVKWNIGSTWILSANVLRPLTTAGINGGWTPTVTFDRTMGQ